MKANELMIGDWVQDIGPVLIDAISNEDVVTYQSTNGYNVTANPSNLKPILLTAEILEKNGFEKFGDYYDVPNDPSLTIKAVSNTYIIGHLINDNFEGFISLDYVHELQHALRICGIEKEVIL